MARIALNGGLPANAVVEYHLRRWDQYFITASGSDQGLARQRRRARLVAYRAEWFKQGGSTPACRFLRQRSLGPNSRISHGDPVE